MVIPIGVCTPTGCEESSHPVQGAVFMGFVVPVVRAEKRARTTGYCPFTPPAWQKRPNSRTPPFQPFQGGEFALSPLSQTPVCSGRLRVCSLRLAAVAYGFQKKTR